MFRPVSGAIAAGGSAYEGEYQDRSWFHAGGGLSGPRELSLARLGYHFSKRNRSMPSSVRVRVCSHGFRVSHGKIAQTEPMGHHNRAGRRMAARQRARSTLPCLNALSTPRLTRLRIRACREKLARRSQRAPAILKPVFCFRCSPNPTFLSRRRANVVRCSPCHNSITAAMCDRDPAEHGIEMRGPQALNRRPRRPYLQDVGGPLAGRFAPQRRADDPRW